MLWLEEAERSFQQALALNPSSSGVHRRSPIGGRDERIRGWVTVSGFSTVAASL